MFASNSFIIFLLSYSKTCSKKFVLLKEFIKYKPVLLKLWLAEVWLPGCGLKPKIVFSTIREYGTAFVIINVKFKN